MGTLRQAAERLADTVHEDRRALAAQSEYERVLASINNKISAESISNKDSAAADKSIDAVQKLLKSNDLGHNTPMTEPLTRPELDAKLETIEARMDGRLERIEDRFASIEKTMDQIGKTLEAQKSIPWKAAAATIAAMIATVIAVAALGFGAFDSGRETAKLAADAKQETAAALAEMRQIVRELKAAPPRQDSPPEEPHSQAPKQ